MILSYYCQNLKYPISCTVLKFWPVEPSSIYQPMNYVIMVDIMEKFWGERKNAEIKNN